MWIGDCIREARQEFQATDTPFRDFVLAELKGVEDKTPDLKYPFE